MHFGLTNIEDRIYKKYQLLLLRTSYKILKILKIDEKC